MTQELGFELTSIVNPVLGQALGGDASSTSTTQPGGGNIAQPGQPQGQPGGSGIFFFAIIMMVGMFLIVSISGRKEKKRRAAMLSSLGKRDKIRTAGGIIGTIVEMKDDEVLIETDKSSHTRLWLARGSVSTVLNSPARSQEGASVKADGSADAELESVSS